MNIIHSPSPPPSPTMNDLVLITSIIDPPHFPLSYGTRSVFTKEERFKQTQQTIASINQFIPDAMIFLIECSKLTDKEDAYFKKHTTLFLNLIDYPQFIDQIYSPLKAIGESTMTSIALQVIADNNIPFNYFHKISGRYCLTKTHPPETQFIVKQPPNAHTHSYSTVYYKLPHEQALLYKHHLESKNTLKKMNDGHGYEEIFYDFITNLITTTPKLNHPFCAQAKAQTTTHHHENTVLQEMHSHITLVDNLGITGYVSVNGEFVEC